MAAVEDTGESRSSSKEASTNSSSAFLGQKLILQNSGQGPVRAGCHSREGTRFGWLMSKGQVPSKMGFDAWRLLGWHGERWLMPSLLL